MKKIIAIGPRGRLEDFQQLPLQNVELHLLDQFYLDLEEIEIPLDDITEPDDEFYIRDVDFSDYDVVFDLALDENPENLDFYVEHQVNTIIGCAVKMSLGEIVSEMAYEPDFHLFGINALPTFLNRSRLEVSLYDGEAEVLSGLIQEMGMEFDIVDDRVGMVTPRIVCMIINEACFVLQEGTADVAAVDQAMKLGTNYPHGPFEWAELIGIQNVFEVLQAIKEDTGEEKYKMAPLLKTYYLKNKLFYN